MYAPNVLESSASSDLGWAMLADECPNVDCYGVPLVRPPRAGGRDPRKVSTAFTQGKSRLNYVCAQRNV